MIDDEAVNALTNALVKNTQLRVLNLSGNHCVTATGWENFSTVLESPYSALKRLILWGNSNNDDILIALANSLANNNKLKQLLVAVSNITCGWAAFSQVLCNSSSIIDTYRSNHTLEKLCEPGYEDGLPEDLRSLLRLNREKIVQAKQHP